MEVNRKGEKMENNPNEEEFEREKGHESKLAGFYLCPLGGI